MTTTSKVGLLVFPVAVVNEHPASSIISASVSAMTDLGDQNDHFSHLRKVTRVIACIYGSPNRGSSSNDAASLRTAYRLT